MRYRLRDPEDLMENGASELNEQLQIDSFAKALSRGAKLCHARNLKWWQNPETKEPVQRNVGELMMLMVSELAEAGEDSPQYNLILMEMTKILCRAMEGHRKNKMDNHLPHRPSIEVELVDCVIRILDLAGAHDMDVEGAFIEKMEFNRVREDHTHEARMKAGGKKF